MRLLNLFGTAFFLVAAALPAFAQGPPGEPQPEDQPPPRDAVTGLQQRIASGEATLEYDETFGWLPAVLAELDVPVSSQTLVFSKTSMQRGRIAPRTPRALYFNDDVYVGYCRKGDVLEISAADPERGTNFYTLDQTKGDRPRFLRPTETCLVCHSSDAHTDGVPGHMLRSVWTDAGGFPMLARGSRRTDHTSPFEERWGGWYVTGRHEGMTHLGNHVVRDEAAPEVADPAGQNVVDLSGRFDESAYLTPHSDLVALTVLAHQTAMHNKIARAAHLARWALRDEATYDGLFADDPAETEGLRESTIRRLDNAAEPVVEYLLMSGEAKLSGRIEGTTSFAADFAARGPRDSKGRSLRDLDLETRLFKHPCSYLIYSEAFDAMPEPVKERVLRRLHEVLTGKEAGKEFAHLSPADREAILEILRETKPNLPDYWRADAAE